MVIITQFIRLFHTHLSAVSLSLSLAHVTTLKLCLINTLFCFLTPDILGASLSLVPVNIRFRMLFRLLSLSIIVSLSQGVDNIDFHIWPLHSHWNAARHVCSASAYICSDHRIATECVEGVAQGTLAPIYIHSTAEFVQSNVFVVPVPKTAFVRPDRGQHALNTLTPELTP